MARDKSKDDKIFNCSQKHELTYVSGLYADSENVCIFLKKVCENGIMNNSTHQEVYEMILYELGYPIPN